eukprot:6210665-Pleurochrysis_carterae.AAC.8
MGKNTAVDAGTERYSVPRNAAQTRESKRRLDQKSEENCSRKSKANNLRYRKTTGVHAGTAGEYTGTGDSRGTGILRQKHTDGQDYMQKHRGSEGESPESSRICDGGAQRADISWSDRRRNGDT